MSLALTPFRRVNPHPGMKLDVQTWADAHQYHRDQLSMHQLTLHGWGIVDGLDVNVVDGVDNTVRIEAGVAVDPAGRFLIVPQSQTYRLTTTEKQTVYLVAQYRDVMADLTPAASERMVEAYRIQERDRLPEEPYIELARVELDPAAGKLRPPRDPENPGKNELDLRFRPRLGTLSAPALRSMVVPPEVSQTDALAPQLDDLSHQVDALGSRLESLSADVGAIRHSPEPNLAQQVAAMADEVRTLAGDVDRLRHAPTPVAAADHPATAESEPPGNGRYDERLESLATQVQHLAARVDAFANQPHAAPVGAPDPRVTDLANRVQTLSQQLDAISTTVRDLRESAPPAAPGITADQVATTVGEHLGAVAQQVDAVAQRIDGLGHRMDQFADQTSSTQLRSDAELASIASRTDGMRHELDALSLQVQALNRQIDTLSATTTSATVLSVPVPTTVSVTTTQAERQKVHIALAEVSAAGWDTHREGLRLLARELSSQSSLEGVAVGNVRVQDAYGLQLLYLSGHAGMTLGDAEVDAIRRLLEEGTTLVGEGCASGPSGETGAREFAMSFVDLANRLGRQLTRVDRDHPLMRVKNIFGELPPGARATARVLESGGMVYSDTDYGCAWQGGAADKPLPRGTIRDAFDFGVNLAVFRLNGT